MKFTKRFAMAIIVMSTIYSAFAQNLEYTELLNKAKNYEKNKKYVYALCTYYDAMMVDPENSETAYERYNTIADAIQNGKPGLDEYDDFSLRDKWINLRREFEKYWSENSALEFVMPKRNLD